MKVIGIAVVQFEIELEVEDISTTAMEIYESDALIRRELDKKLPNGITTKKLQLGESLHNSILVEKTVKE